MAVTIQLKRGSSTAWKKLNPTLAIGEPGFEKDTGRLKIGDGISPWNDLPYQDENRPEIFNAESIEFFPKEGDVNIIYKASQTAELYQWNPINNSYELLNVGKFSDIKLINGGNANG